MHCFLYKKSIIKLGCEKMSFEDLIKVKSIKNKQELESLINQYLDLINTKRSTNDTVDDV